MGRGELELGIKDAIYNSLFPNMEESILILGDHTGLSCTTLTHTHNWGACIGTVVGYFDRVRLHIIKGTKNTSYHSTY